MASPVIRTLRSRHAAFHNHHHHYHSSQLPTTTTTTNSSLSLPRIMLLLMTMMMLCLLCCTPHTAAAQEFSTYPEEVHRMVLQHLRQQRGRSRGGSWGEWSAWSACSRSCGGGVTIQSRECLSNARRERSPAAGRNNNNNNNNNNKSRCVGLYRRFQLCNTQSCGPGYVDFRREQCAAFNKTPFNRRFYTWEPYYDAPDSCALNCRAIGLSFYATLNQTVIDGTHCGLPDANRFCVAGRCLAVGCDGVLGSGVALDSCGVCGGDNSSCRVIAGVFSHPKMHYGYNLIATLPRGAANITIQQVQPSTNYLALRHPSGEFFLNGNWAANISGYYNIPGLLSFTYQRADMYSGDKVTAMGPLLQPVDVMLFYHSLNPGIKYEYRVRLPVTPGSSPSSSSSSPRLSTSSSMTHTHTQNKRRQGADNPLNPLVPGGPASRTPHAGPVNDARSLNPSTNSIQSSVFWKERQDELELEEKEKKKKKKRKKERRGGRKGSKRGRSGAKPKRKKYEWKVVGFSSCSETCGGGSQTTRVVCVKRKRGNEVPTTFCHGLTRPDEETVRCNLRPCPPTWTPGDWEPCSVTCGMGVQTRTLSCQMRMSPSQYVEQPEGACLTPSPMERARVCELPACDASPEWSAGEWGACSVQCGLGTRHREVTCGTASGTLDESQCDTGSKPSNQELCDMGSCATDTWFFSPYEDSCSDYCSEGVQRRRVHCSGNPFDNPRTETSCDTSLRPAETRPCPAKDECGGKWFTGPWGECSAVCGEGRRSRSVVCVVFRGRWRITTDLAQCKGQTRPDSSEPCTRSCGPQWFSSDWSQCTVSCGTGVRRREVKCLDANLDPAPDCTRATKPFTREPCNTQSCPENENEIENESEQPTTPSTHTDPSETEQADESVANVSRSEIHSPQGQQTSSSSSSSSLDNTSSHQQQQQQQQQSSGNVNESQTGWRASPLTIEINRNTTIVNGRRDITTPSTATIPTYWEEGEEEEERETGDGEEEEEESRKNTQDSSVAERESQSERERETRTSSSSSSTAKHTTTTTTSTTIHIHTADREKEAAAEDSMGDSESEAAQRFIHIHMSDREKEGTDSRPIGEREGEQLQQGMGISGIRETEKEKQEENEKEEEKKINDSSRSSDNRRTDGGERKGKGRERQRIRHIITPGRPWIPGAQTGLKCMDRMKNCHLVFKARLCRLKYYNKLCCDTCSNSTP